VYRQIEGDDFSCWICSECDGESATVINGPHRSYPVPERDNGTGSTLDRFRAAADRVAPNKLPNTLYVGNSARPGFLIVRVPRIRARKPVDRRQALETLAGKPWFADVRYVGCDVRWYVFERPDDRLAAAARRMPTYDAAAALQQMSSTPRADGRCVNETRSGSHGMATDGVRCATCAAIHKRSA